MIALVAQEGGQGLARGLIVLLQQLPGEGFHQAGADAAENGAGDDAAGLAEKVRLRGAEQGMAGEPVLQHNMEQVGIERARGNQDRQIVGVVVGSGDNACRVLHAGRGQFLGLGAAAGDGARRAAGLLRFRMNHHHLHVPLLQQFPDGAADPAEAADTALARRALGPELSQ